MKKVLSLVMALVLVFGMATTSFADNLDLTNIVDNSKSYSWSEFVKVPTNTIYVGNNIDDYVIEYNNEFYSAKDLDEATKDGTSLIDAIAGLEPVDAPEVPEEPTGDLEVIEISAIDNTGVTVVVEAVTEANEEVTVTVLNSKGEEVAVVARPVEVGDTELIFDFVTEVEDEDLVGIWKVNGEEYDFDALAAVNAVNDATNLVELWAALQSPYFTGAVEANVSLYDAKLDGTQETVAEVQDVIDEVNTSVVGNKEAATVVKAVEEATNELELLRALEDNFDRVNPDWITKVDTIEGYFTYDSSTDGADYTEVDHTATDIEAELDKIQAIIDTVNTNFVTDAITKAEADLDSTKVTKARNLVNAYIVDDEEDDDPKVKAGYLENLDIHQAVINVNLANTNAKLANAFNALGALTDDFDADLVETTLLSDYRTAIAEETIVTKKNTATLLQGIVTTINGNKLSEIEAAIAATDADTTEADLLALLQSPVIGLENVNAAYIAEYKAALIAETTDTNKNAKAAIQTNIIDAVNTAQDEDARLVAVNEATTAEEMRTALTAVAIAEDLTDYINLSSQGKLEVAELVLAARADEPNEEFAGTTNVTTAVGGSSSGAIQARQNLIDGVNGATDIAAMNEKLGDLEYKAFDDLTALEKVEVAEAFLNAFPEDEDGNRINYTDRKSVV